MTRYRPSRKDILEHFGFGTKKNEKLQNLSVLRQCTKFKKEILRSLSYKAARQYDF